MNLLVKFSLSLALLIPSTLLLATSNVKLLTAYSSIGSKYGRYWQNTEAKILVKNISYEKKVSLHLKRGDKEWIDVPAEFERKIDDTWEIWKVEDFSGDEISTLSFVIKYEVDHNTYWDNNGGKNYRLKANDGHISNEAVLVERMTLYSYEGTARSSAATYLSGTVMVKNLGFEKKVTLVYTFDDWETSKMVPFMYSHQFLNDYALIPSPNRSGIEYWNIYLPIEGGMKTMQYAVAYDVNGVTYWDNNFGNNYILEIEEQDD